MTDLHNYEYSTNSLRQKHMLGCINLSIESGEQQAVQKYLQWMKIWAIHGHLGGYTNTSVGAVAIFMVLLPVFIHCWCWHSPSKSRTRNLLLHVVVHGSRCLPPSCMTTVWPHKTSLYLRTVVLAERPKLESKGLGHRDHCVVSVYRKYNGC